MDFYDIFQVWKAMLTESRHFCSDNLQSLKTKKAAKLVTIVIHQAANLT